MSNRKASWVDYANLGANIAQIGQLSDVRRRLGELSSIEAAREERRQLERELKQFVFDVESGLDRLLEYSDKAPLGVIFSASALKLIFDEIGIEPATFDEFVDKDRVKKVRDKIESIVERTEENLKPEELEESRKFLERLSKLSEIEQILEHFQTTQELTKKEGTWLKQKASRDKRMTASIAAIIIGLIFCSSNPFLSEYALTLVIIAVFLAGGGLYGVITSSPKGFRKLERERLALRKKRLSATRMKKIKDNLGDLSQEEYQSLYDETIAYINRVNNNDKDGNPLSVDLYYDVVLPRALQSKEESK